MPLAISKNKPLSVCSAVLAALLGGLVGALPACGQEVLFAEPAAEPIDLQSLPVLDTPISQQAFDPAYCPPGVELVLKDEPVEDWVFHTMPRGTIYHTYWASAAEPRLEYRLVNEDDIGALSDSYLGGRVGLWRYGPKNKAEGLQFDLLAGAKLRQDADNELTVDATDYRADLLLTYGDGRDRYKFGYYHISSHLVDDFIFANPGVPSVNFVRDALLFGYSYYWTPRLRLYAEAAWAFNVEVSEPWEFQFGIDYGPAGPTGFRGEPFFAINGHLREELDFGGNLALQAGWAWKADYSGAGTFRTGLYYYNGFSRQFSFFDDFEQQVGWGAFYDF
ncbi:MAG: DUF1207 domain-containing protein [Planctomycetota bacterium]